MSNHNGNGLRSKLKACEIAREWLNLGVQPVPLKRKSKVPKAVKGWNTLRVTEGTIDRFFSPGDNIGGLWGEPSKWIVDIDLDWDEASEVAVHLLPETFIYGRASRPGSHFLYRCRGITGSKRKLRTGEVIAEIRSTGSQSVLPPSIHPDNERYEINHDVPFTEIPRVELEQKLSEVAAAAVLVHYFPEGGSRHDYVHAITGALLWSGWPEKRVRIFMNAILNVTCSQDDDSDQRLRTIRNTIEHFKEGDRIAGWKTLSDWLDGQVIQVLRTWLTPKKKFEAPPEANKHLPQFSVIPAFDKSLLDVPGLVGELSLWSGKNSYLDQPTFDLASGLMCVALASSNNYIVQGWNTPLQPYFMLLAPTAAGKGAALSNIINFARQIDMEEAVFGHFQSFYALLDKLAEEPHRALWLWDEAARHLASARSPASTDYVTLSHIISLYGRANDYVPAVPGRKQTIPPLERPFFTLLATAQPNQLIDAVTTTTIATGFINRLVLFDAGDRAPRAKPHHEHFFPSTVKRQALTLRDHSPQKDVTMIKFDAHTYAQFSDFDAGARMMASQGDESEIWGRANQNALMLAGIVAVGINPKKPMITQGIADWAIALVRWSIGCWMSRITSSSAINLHEGYSKRVEGYIRRSKQLSHRTKNPKYKELMSQGRMARSVLITLCRFVNARQLDEIIQTLVEGDLVGVTEDSQGCEIYWPKS